MKRIAIIYYDKEIRELLNLMLNGKYLIDLFDNPEYIVKEQFILPDLFLLDIQMPYMNGLALCKLLREKNPTEQTPIIIMSGKNGFERDAFEAGASAVMKKPFDLGSLYELVTKTLGT